MLISEERITRANATAVKAAMLESAARGDAAVDLSQVRTVDSSAVAMLLAWVRVLQAKGEKPEISGVPEKMVSLMRLYGTYELLSPFFVQEKFEN